MSRQLNIGYIAQLLPIFNIWVYNKKEQGGKKERKYGEKKRTMKLNVTAKVCVERATVIVTKFGSIKKRPDLYWINKNGVQSSRQHPATPPNDKREPKAFSALRKQLLQHTDTDDNMVEGSLSTY